MDITEQHKQLHNAIIEVINNQLENDTPKETKETLNRLMAEGYSEDQAMNLISHIVAAEVVGVIAEGRKYDEIRYITALQGLPDLPESSKGTQKNV